ncbi:MULTISPECIES: hypothetical protein [unclassified Embleya]|uniref:hypothetical protein n=1 Tax=unclassified Embleya TaxID=2699296 RepID=UPI0033C86A07
MDIIGAPAIVVVPNRDDEVEVEVDLHDWPVDGDVLPHTWNGVIHHDLGLEVGEQLALFLVDENSALGHPCVVTSNADHRTRVCAREGG